MSSHIVVVDDDGLVREFMGAMLQIEGYQISEAASLGELGGLLSNSGITPPDVLFLDLNLPDGSGLEFLPRIRAAWPDTQVIVLTGNGSFDAAVEATKLGAYHFQAKPFEPKTVLPLVRRAIEHRETLLEARSLRQAISTLSGGIPPVFQSHAMQSVVRLVERVAPTDVTILVTGESGTGKEVIADLLHQLSPRNKGPLVKVNCAALPRELIESELFGSVKGAFTGAITDREGLFRQADKGSLMLDELAEMPVDTQTKLLRVLQEKEVRPVGGRASHKTDCRLIAATNRIPAEAIRDGKLREDLYYRISAVSIHLPPLRERREDILPLANAFLRRFASQAGRTYDGFTAAAADTLSNHAWPGNIRQLQNVIQRAVLTSETRKIDAQELALQGPGLAPAVPSQGFQPGGNSTGMTLMETLERNAIIQMLKDTGGNKVETAKRLGIGRQTLYNKLKTYQIQP